MAAQANYVSVAGSGDNSGDDKDNCMAMADFDTDLTSNCEAGDIYYVLSGTYTLTSDISTTLDGGNKTPIKIIGCSNHDPVTEASGDDRPLFACGSYSFGVDDYFILGNLRLTGTSLYLFGFGAYSIAYNCKAYNSSGTNDRHAIRTDGPMANIWDCEGQCTNGRGITHEATTFGGGITHCYAHDSSMGFRVMANNVGVVECIADTCTYGIYVNGWGGTIINCVAYNCSTRGIDLNANRGNIVINCIIESCGVGVYCDDTYSNLLDYNNYHGNTTDATNCTKGANATAYDPSFEGAAGGDFRLSSGSDCIGAGFGMRLGIGS